MADGFGLKIGVEGEREFKKSLSEINQTFKVLGSEMKLVQSQFDKNDNSVEALTARNATLNKQIDAQKEKINTLKCKSDCKTPRLSPDKLHAVFIEAYNENICRFQKNCSATPVYGAAEFCVIFV